ncbi:AAA family ATPase, partial [Nostoc sp. NIES-2111]
SVESESYLDKRVVLGFNIDKYIKNVGSLNGSANSNEFFQRIFNDSKGDLVKDDTRVEPFFDKNDIVIRKREVSKDDPLNKAKVKISVKKNIATVVVDLKDVDEVKLRPDNLVTFFSENFIIDFRPMPYIFTAERLGIALFYKELDATRASIFQELQSNSRDIDLAQIMRRSSAYYAVPIKRNIDFTRSIDVLALKPKNVFNRYALRLISQLAGGEYAQGSSDEIRFHNPESESVFNIPLYLASSSVRALSDLYFYLSYEARPGHILIIDEPESHLTIEKQRIMARLLAAIVNAKIKVVITTHSDFLLRELNNL